MRWPLIALLLSVLGCVSADNVTTTTESSRVDKVMKAPFPSGMYNPSGSQQHLNRDRGEVSETDLYLLGAIEKLTYRLDFIEKRLRRTEDLLYHVMAGQNNAAHKQPGEKADACPANFTRAAGGCYFFSTDPLPGQRRGSAMGNWKAAAAACKALGQGAALVELESVEETQDIVTHLKADPKIRDKSYWTGGLNPGLLWIWADSGRPVSANGGHKKPGGGKKQEIRGNGRCLLLGYDPGFRGYNLVGADCSAVQHFICEAEDNNTGQALDRIQRNLRLFGNTTAHS
ncbi:uncharacterized protein LOC132198539 isoform X2 [Neocloeon triangulifer]|uniref:uncharacterized protein LOC132198539 isoform X2 n=1 Tax=Neocloeon triangulifer TaxID=2078957 RepID=UPI00286F83CD|nr:uncharacterized protein LOC132198539 isoform X2 [Neocloeon triangulifer]